MAELTPDVIILKENHPGYTNAEIAGLNLELMDMLGDLEPGTAAYTKRARAFHDKVSRRCAASGKG